MELCRNCLLVYFIILFFKPRLPPKPESVLNAINTESKSKEDTNDVKKVSDEETKNTPPQNNRRSVYSFGSKAPNLVKL